MLKTDRKLNVLVCRDAGATPNCVNQCIYTLRRLLSPRYAVIPIGAQTLVTEPWAATCALLVLPGGADLGYCRAFNGAGNAKIRRYVQSGGSFLGFCAGAYYGSTRCEFEAGSDPKRGMEVVGDRELAFFPGTCRGAAFKGFKYDSELGARAVLLRPLTDRFVEEKKQSPAESEPASLDSTPFRVYTNGGGAFVDAKSAKDTEILATYGEPVQVDAGDGIASGQSGAAAVVYCKVRSEHATDGQDEYGHVLLSSVHPEFATINLDRNISVPGYLDLIAALKKDEHRRISFLILCLRKLGLQVNDLPVSVPTLSNLHLSSTKSGEAARILSSLSRNLKQCTTQGNIPGGLVVGKLEGGVDTFVLYKNSGDFAVENVSMSPSATTDGLVDYSKVVKHLIVHDDNTIPSSLQTPKFDHKLYYQSLEEAYEEARRVYPSDVSGDLGKTLLCGQVVTSTNTLLEKNPALLEHLPHGLSFVATNQVAGRGRGSNPWISPTGSLILSTVLHLPLPTGSSASSSCIVFVQYLTAIAAMRAIRGYGKLDKKRRSTHNYNNNYDDDDNKETIPVAIKWPNDIYARPPGQNRWLKIGGILVQSSYSSAANCLSAVMGIGINVAVPSNPASAVPTVSLNEVAEKAGFPSFRVETLVARLIVGLDAALSQFEKEGWKGVLEREYINTWLHSDQLIKVDHSGGTEAKSGGSNSTVRSFATLSMASNPLLGRHPPVPSSSTPPPGVLYARILGLTPDWGELLVEEEEVSADDRGSDGGDGTNNIKNSKFQATSYPAGAKDRAQAGRDSVHRSKAGKPTGRYWRLQPDNNSFDFFSGLIVKRM